MTENELIAEFIGYRKRASGEWEDAKGIPLSDGIHWFESSWDWLMPVVEKIEKVMCSGDLRFVVEIHWNGCRVYRSWVTVDNPHFGWHQTGSKFKSTYEAVVEFIKWYNSNKQTQ